jgi:hypothetical protein
MDVLLGRVIPLQLGFIGVVNRSQQDIFEGVLEQEEEGCEEREGGAERGSTRSKT